MVLFNTYGVFFSRFLESRNYKIQVIAHVGRKVGRPTLGVNGGFLLPFFYRARFQLLTSRFSQASKTTTNEPPDTLGDRKSGV